MKTIICLLILSISVFCSQAQTYEEFVKQKEQEMKSAEKHQQDGIDALQDDYRKYVEEQDKAFSEYLKRRWQEFQVFSGVELPKDPKPNLPPKVDPNDHIKDRQAPFRKLRPTDVSTVTVNKTDILFVEQLPKIKPVTLPAENTDDILFGFYGAKIRISADKKMIIDFNSRLSEESIAKYWDKITASEYINLVNDLARYADQLQLNDWAYYMLVDEYASQIHPNDKISSQLLTWFILLKSGYRVKIAYSGNNVSILLPAFEQIYSNEYIRLGNTNYYMTSPITTSVYTYEKDFKGASKDFHLNFSNNLKLPIKRGIRNLNFNYDNRDYNVSIAYNKNMVSFYNAYPSIDLSNHFNSPVSDITSKSISKEFNPILQGRTQEDQANLLLTFIHKALPYKTDGDQFGKEKYFFVEDIFSFSYSDCEDRSILYAYLIDELVGLKTIGLDAPGHVFTAVQFDHVLGDYIDFNGGSFTICDPTYIGAKVGKGMPLYMNNDLKVIPKKLK